MCEGNQAFVLLLGCCDVLVKISLRMISMQYKQRRRQLTSDHCKVFINLIVICVFQKCKYILVQCVQQALIIVVPAYFTS